MAGENIWSWSPTAANNGTADSLINWAEGMARAAVNNSARSMMAAHAKVRDLNNGSVTTGGSGNAQTLTTAIGFSGTIPAGMRILVKLGFTNSGAATLNVDGTGAVTIKDLYGNDLVAGALTANSYAELIYNGTNWILVNPIQVGGFTTGDAKITLKTTADTGWIMMDDGTIGDGSSGASTRANDDTGGLFTLIWNNVIDTWAPVVSGRGASAAADFAAHKKLTLTKQLGRALAISGAGSGLTSRALGENLGEQTHVLTIAELAVHSHGTHANYSGGINVSLDAGVGVTPVVADAGGSAQNAGSGTAHNNMQPTSFWNVMLKL